ncbi:unnamed protein product [Caenorhabditis sp. 36 PRJEB53466]|nr:unnamed protein product [Caenorhabditis sp. 36 PRJEB53466]
MTEEEPPRKVRKVQESLRIKVIPILGRQFTCEAVPSTPFEALKLENKRVIGQIICRLKELPEELQHLKRVEKDGSVLISKSRKLAEQLVADLAHPDVRLEDLRTVQVPAIKPLTRRQFEFAKNLWATGFHPDHEIERLLDGSFLTSSFREYVFRWIQKALEMKDGCVAVQNDVQLSSGRPSAHPLGHPTMEMIGSLPKRTDHSTDYLGTGADVFLATEPCAMCAMALVHFRAKRIFFARPTENGVLSEGGWQLHLDASINHHYDVFRVEIPEEINNFSNFSVFCKNSD